MPTQPINPYLGNPFDPSSAQGQWWQGTQEYQNTTPYNYQQAGFDPNNPFGTTMINPVTGESYAITPGMEITNQWTNQNLWDQALAEHGWMSPGAFQGINIGGQSFASMDPQGNLNFNPGALSGAMGGAGAGGGYDFTDYPSFTPYQAGEISQVGPYEVSDFAQQIIDTNNVINAALPGIYEQQEKGFANAANRMGQSGLMGTPYAEALGEVSRKSGLDIAALTEQYRYGASEALAERRMQEELQQRQLEEAAWEAQNMMNMQAQMANQQNQFEAWQAQNQYGQNQWLNQNQLGMQNYWNQQGQTQDQFAQMMAMIMGSIPQGGGMGMP